MADKPALELVAAELGLTLARSRLNPFFSEAGGLVEGQHVRVAASDQGTGATADIHPPLDLGLGVGSKNFALDLIGAGRVAFGDPDIDDELGIRCDEPERGRALLSAPVRQRLLALNREFLSLRVSDALVSVTTPQADVDGIRGAALGAARLAGALDARRGDVPAAGPVDAHGTLLAFFAEAQRLALAHAPLRLDGAIGAARVALRIPRVAEHRFRVELVVVPLEPGPERGLEVRPATLADRAKGWLGARDLETGDATFDQAFFVRCDAPTRARALLDEAARVQLADLAAHADELRLDDRALVLHAAASRLPAEALPRLVLAAVELVERTGRELAAEHAGPYR